MWKLQQTSCQVRGSLLHYTFPISRIFICMEYRKHINVRITEEQFIRLMKTVDQQESNLSELMRKMIDRYEKQKAKLETGKDK